MFLFVVPQTQGHAQAKFKAVILRAGFFFPVDLLPGATWGNSRKICWHPPCLKGKGLLTPVQMEMVTPGMLDLRRAWLWLRNACSPEEDQHVGKKWIFQEQPSPPVCLAVRGTCLWTGTQHVIILGSFPFRSMTLGESLTSHYALLREYKTVSGQVLCISDSWAMLSLLLCPNESILGWIPSDMNKNS